MTNFKHNVAQALYDPSSSFFMPVNNALAALTVVSVCAVALETVEGLEATYRPIFYVIELIAVTCFTVEYLLRIWTAKRAVAYICSFSGVVDFLSIVPALASSAGVALILRKIRILRVLRLLRTLRARAMHKYGARHKMDGARLERRGMHKSLALINTEIYFIVLFSSIFLLATAIFAVEGDRPEFENIPLAILWVAEMIFGGSISGVLPLTKAGIVIAIATRFVGLVLFGLLIMVIGNGVSHLLFGENLSEVEGESS